MHVPAVTENQCCLRGTPAEVTGGSQLVRKDPANLILSAQERLVMISVFKACQHAIKSKPSFFYYSFSNLNGVKYSEVRKYAHSPEPNTLTCEWFLFSFWLKNRRRKAKMTSQFYLGSRLDQKCSPDKKPTVKPLKVASRS